MPPWQPTAVVTVAILFLTLAQHPLGEEPIELFEGADKIVHALMFLGFAAVVATDRFMSGCRDSLAALIAIAVGATAFGGVIEIIQTAMGRGRSGDWTDLVADCVGAVVGVVIFSLVRPKLRRQ